VNGQEEDRTWGKKKGRYKKKTRRVKTKKTLVKDESTDKGKRGKGGKRFKPSTRSPLLESGETLQGMPGRRKSSGGRQKP